MIPLHNDQLIISQFEDQQLENGRKLAKVQTWLGAGGSENVLGALCS